MVEYDPGLVERVNMTREKFAYHDRRAAEVQAVRRGDFDKVAEGSFSEEWPRPIVANLIDTYARHASAALSPLPSFVCKSASMTSDAAKKRADKRTKIVNNYVERSELQHQMQQGADQFYTYGLIVTEVTPNWDEKRPELFVEDSLGWYPVWNRRGDTVEASHVFTRRLVELCAEYPEFENRLKQGRSFRGQGENVEVIRHDNGKHITMMVPACGGLVLSRVANPTGECLTVVTKKPGLDDEVRGTFDDLIWVQLARNELQRLMLAAAADSVEAPIVVPADVTDVPSGANAIIRTQNPGGVSRVRLEVPSAVFAGVDHLKGEMQSGAITPEALGGSIDASVVTGKGVQELMAGYSQQIAMAQETLVGHMRRLVAKALKLDEVLWPDVEKQISGHTNGSAYSLKYKPGEDVGGDYTVDVTYGTSTGLDPNRHLVYLLQAQGAGLMSKDTVIRSMPNAMNAMEEMAKIQIEQGRDALMQMVSGLAQSIPGIIAQGGDASQTTQQVAMFVDMLQKGKPIEEIASKVFAPPPPPPEPDPAAAGGVDPLTGQPAAPGGEAGFEPQPGADATSGAGGRPALSNLFAGLSSNGKPNLGSFVSRQTPVA